MESLSSKEKLTPSACIPSRRVVSYSLILSITNLVTYIFLRINEPELSNIGRAGHLSSKAYFTMSVLNVKENRIV